MRVRCVSKMIFLLAVFVVYLWTGTISANAQGTVRLSNLSRPFTRFEVGQRARAQITGAIPDKNVTYTITCAPVACPPGPYTVGKTDASGNFTLDNTPFAPEHVGSYEEIWYVNSVVVPADNPDDFYVPSAPKLPSFTVYANFTGTNCSTQSMGASGCNPNNTPLHWIWSPVTYRNDSTAVDSSTVNMKAGDWNAIQNKIQFSSNTSHSLDVRFYDYSSLPPGLVGATITYGEDCNVGCFNHTAGCPVGACLNEYVVYYVNIRVDGPEIARFASALCWPDYTQSCKDSKKPALAAWTVAHEMGHALRLGDVHAENRICTQVQDVMEPELSLADGCGVNAPTSCDTNGINTVYPSAVRYCSPDVTYYCGPGYCV